MENVQSLAAMLNGPWSNGACRGYVVYAMENLGFKPEDIHRVIDELHYVFDVKSVVEADEHSCGSPY